MFRVPAPAMTTTGPLNAVATAGGFTYRADTRRVFIRRDGSTAEEAYAIGPTLQVAPGDTIRIAERLF